MKKKPINCILINIVIILVMISIYRYIDKYNIIYEIKYNKEIEGLELASGEYSAYCNSIYKYLSTIAFNDEYGTFVFKTKRKFYYFPKEKNIMDNTDNVYLYMGYWEYSSSPNIGMKFTVLRTYFNNDYSLDFMEKTIRKCFYKELYNISFIEKKHYILFNYTYLYDENTKYNNDLLIKNEVFRLLDNDLTNDCEEKLLLGEDIINTFLEKELNFFKIKLTN